MALLKLPNELLLTVADNISTNGDLNALIQVNCRLYVLLNGSLYRKDARQGRSRALLWGARNGLEGTVRFSLAAGGDCETTRRGQQPPAPYPWQCRLFSVNGYSCMATPGHDDLTPLHLAIIHKHESIAQILIEHGADIGKAYPKFMAQCSPLHFACSHGLTATVRLLVDKGAKLEAQDVFGQRPLHYAISPYISRPRCKGNIETVIYLLEKGAKYAAKDKRGRRPEDLIKSNFSRACYRSPCRWSEQEKTDDNWAEKRIQQLLEVREAERTVQKWDENRELSRKKRLTSENVSQGRLTKRKEERSISRRRKEEAEEKERRYFQEQRAREAEILEKIVKASKAKEESEKKKRIVEEQLAELSIQQQRRQEAARKKWSLLKEQAEQKTCNTTVATSNITTTSCEHPFIGWSKHKARSECQLCKRICAKCSFKCPDCGFVVCMQCKQQF